MLGVPENKNKRFETVIAGSKRLFYVLLFAEIIILQHF